MSLSTPPRPLALFAVATLLFAACDDAAPSGDANAQQEATPAPTNRIDLPPVVRRNLGIEFVSVRRRHVVGTLRLPATVQLLPSATRHYRAPLAGRVTVHVAPLQRVVEGDLLYTLDSPEWRAVQRELDEQTRALAVTDTRLEAMQPLLEACERHEHSLRTAESARTAFLELLEHSEERVGGQASKLAMARVEMAQLQAQIAEAAEKHTETLTRIAELRATQASQRRQLELTLAGAAATLGISPAALRSDDGEGGWRALTLVEVRAAKAGLVDRVSVADGDLVAAFDHVITTVDPTRVRCHARALQSDAAALADGLSAHIVPATARASDTGVPGVVALGPIGDATTRTLDLYVTPAEGAELRFVRPGHAVFVEVVTRAAGKPDEEPLVIPKAAVLPDGLDRVFFRRDPRDPDKVIRVEADLGRDDGTWVEIRSGLVDGDEVVLAGAFELVLASGGNTPKGGHFHADGTWHEDH